MERDAFDKSLDRRQLLTGGLLLSVAALTGCGSRKKAAEPMATPHLDDFLAAHRKTGTAASARPQWGLPSGVIPRQNWTRAAIARPRDVYPMRGIRRITVHHDGMPPVWIRTADDAADRIEMIRRSHVESRGFADIGYHYIVDPQGRIWEGRAVSLQGAHVRDNNENNLGILVLGNFERQTPTTAATHTLDAFVAAQMEKYRVPLRQIRTHREITVTECPGESLQRYMNSTRSRGGGLVTALAATGGEALLVG